jgi:hypothetical protein
MTDQMMRALPHWSLGPIVDSLVALRGIDKVAAMVLLAELGDISRFESPKQRFCSIQTPKCERNLRIIHFSATLRLKRTMEFC